jgi:hypothetical protein
MNNHDNRELDRLLTCDIRELLAAITPMSADDCEHYARAILDRVGGPTFEQYLMRITETMIPEGGSGPPTNSDDYYFAVRDLFPKVSTDDDVLGRLAAFVMRMCQLRMGAHTGPLM